MAKSLALGLLVLLVLLAPAAIAGEPGATQHAGWLSIVPALAAIAVALVTRSVIPALLFGIWLGAWIALGFDDRGNWSGFVLTDGGIALLDTIGVYIRDGMADSDRVSIILFSLLIGGMVGIISRNGGLQGVVNFIVRYANTDRRAQAATAGLGVAIFFDDYANSMVVGNTLRPITDAHKVSREKLAYLVDSTAAPVATIALVTTWIGYEVGLIDTAARQLSGLQESAYSIFLGSLAYSFYPILAIAFVFLIAWSGRDFGPMLQAERRARSTGKLLRDGAQIDRAAIDGDELLPEPKQPQRAANAIVPIIVLIGGVMAGLLATGEGEHLREIVGSADAYTSLVWASLSSCIIAAALSLAQRILSLEEVIAAWYAGLRIMMMAMIILVLAWALADTTSDIGTADFLTQILGASLPPALLPAIVFVLAALIAFATGSSWSTMGILMPLVVPLSWAMIDGDASQMHIFYSAISCVLAGAVWGDHCSPISDTTVLSSMASGCDHIDHVRTQLPYALTVGLIGLLLGTLPTAMGLPSWLAFAISLGAPFVVHRALSRPVAQEASERESQSSKRSSSAERS
ncbi:MAG: Na+/H+ antiporter NhaC family protein [Gammaproteobacteria bacterium]|nr:Na+/H+ antiporter NhaC family protein [Gammaproteobacteria bacterium]